MNPLHVRLSCSSNLSLNCLHINLGLPSVFFPSRFPAKNLYGFTFFRMPSACPKHLFPLKFRTSMTKSIWNRGVSQFSVGAGGSDHRNDKGLCGSDHLLISVRTLLQVMHITQLSIPTQAQLQRHRLKFIKNHLKTPTCFGLRPSSGSYNFLAKITIIIDHSWMFLC